MSTCSARCQRASPLVRASSSPVMTRVGSRPIARPTWAAAYRLSPLRILMRMPNARSWPTCSTMPSLSGSANRTKPIRVMSCSSVRVVARTRRQVADGDREHAQPKGCAFGDERVDSAPRRLVQRASSVAVEDVAAAPEHGRDGAFSNQRRRLRALARNSDRQPFAHEIAGDLVALSRRVDRQSCLAARRDDGRVERILDPRCERRVGIGVPEHTIGGRTVRVDRRRQFDVALRQCATE